MVVTITLSLHATSTNIRQPSRARVIRGTGVHVIDVNVTGLKCGIYGVGLTMSPK